MVSMGLIVNLSILNIEMFIKSKNFPETHLDVILPQFELKVFRIDPFLYKEILLYLFNYSAFSLLFMKIYLKFLL